MNEHMIVLFNPKGGVGKTIIADELAFSSVSSCLCVGLGL